MAAKKNSTRILIVVLTLLAFVVWNVGFDKVWPADGATPVTSDVSPGG